MNGTDPTTKVEGRDETGKFIKGYKPVTTFADRPGDRSDGGWKKENTITYQYNRFINMTPDQLKEFVRLPDSQKTMAMVLALNRVLAANKSLPDMKEITDRTEGKAKESIDHTSGGEKMEFMLYKPERIADTD